MAHFKTPNEGLPSVAHHLGALLGLTRQIRLTAGD